MDRLQEQEILENELTIQTPLAASDPSKNIKHKNKRPLSTHAEIVMSCLTSMILVTYVALNYVSFHQLKLTRETIDNSSDSFRIDKRAWVELEPIKPVPSAGRYKNIGAVFGYEIYPRNVGKTAARNIKYRSLPSPFTSITAGSDIGWTAFQQQLLLKQVPSAHDIPLSRLEPHVLPPNTVAAVPFTTSINAQEPQVFPASSYVHYLVGRIDYCDQFKIPHWLTFCYYVADSKGNLKPCEEGNDEDQNSEITPKNGCTLP
jgi:hypothetical protein